MSITLLRPMPLYATDAEIWRCRRFRQPRRHAASAAADITPRRYAPLCIRRHATPAATYTSIIAPPPLIRRRESPRRTPPPRYFAA